jgi:hypothetical protein
MPFQHYCHYSPKAIRALFAKANFETVKLLQDSMDHRLRAEYCHRWQDVVKGIAIYATAVLGAVIGMGDQLIAIGRAPAHSGRAYAH